MTAADQLIAAVATRVGNASMSEVTAPPATRLSWRQTFGSEAIGSTLRAHARAVGCPEDQAGTMVAGQVVAGLARVQAWSLALEGCWFDIAPEDLGLFVADGRVLRAVDVTAARVISAPTGTGDTRILDATIEAVVACCAEASGRVPTRVVASEALFAWYAALRQISGLLGPLTPAEVLEADWRSRWSFYSLTRRIEVSASRTYLARAVCCLEYRCDPPDQRRYCTSCPMVDPELVREHLQASRPVQGERRPFKADALGRTRPQHGTS